MSGEEGFHVENNEETKRFRDNYCVLLLISEETCRVNLSEMLRKCGYRVMSTTRADELPSIIDTEKISLVLADIRLIQMNNYELLEKITSICEIPVVVAGEDVEDTVISECLLKGAEYCLPKPLMEWDLKNLWQFIVRKQRDFRSQIEKKDSTIHGETPGKKEMQNENRETDDQISQAKKRKEIMGVETGEHAKKDSGFDLDDQKKPKLIWAEEANNERKEPTEIKKIGEESVNSNSQVKKKAEVVSMEDELEKWSSHPASYFSSYVHYPFPKLDFTPLESIGETKGDIEIPLSPRESSNKKNVAALNEEMMEDGISLSDLDFDVDDGEMDSKANEDLFNEIFTDLTKDLKP